MTLNPQLASDAVLQALAQANLLPLDGAALLAALAFLGGLSEGEGGISFRTLFGSGTMQAPDPRVQETKNSHGAVIARTWTGSLDIFPPWPGAKLPDGTVTHAAGFLQDEPATDSLISTAIGDHSFQPATQIVKNWWLAQHDFHARSGLDLLATIEAGDWSAVEAHLIETWPSATNVGARFADNRAALQALLPPSPPPPPPSGAVALPVGMAVELGITATDQYGPVPLAADAFHSSNEAACSAKVSGTLLILGGLASGSAVVSGPAGCTVAAQVIARSPTSVTIDTAHPVYKPLGS